MKYSVKIPFNFETPWKKSHLSQMTKKGNISTYNASVTQRIKGPHKSPTRKDRRLFRHNHVVFSVFIPICTSPTLGIQTSRLSLSAQAFRPLLSLCWPSLLPNSECPSSYILYILFTSHPTNHPSPHLLSHIPAHYS